MRAWVAAAVAVLALAPFLSGCLGADANVVASAPKRGNGMTVSVAAEPGLAGGPPDEMSYSIVYEGEEIYPPRGLGGIELDGAGMGSKFIPYGDFVVGNGDYHVNVADGARETPVNIQKYVRYVFLNPYMDEDGERIVVDLTLESAPGGHPQDRVIAQGQLSFDVRYRGENGTRNQSAHSFVTETNPDRTFTRVSFDPEEMDHFKGEGYYSVGVTFDNQQARGNFNVGLDPLHFDRDPPRHWIYVEVEDEEDDGILPPPE